MSEPKQVIVLRTDLRNAQGHKIRTGKLIAQGAHASLKAILPLIYNNPSHNINQYSVQSVSALNQWLEGRFTKVCVSVDSEQELIGIIDKAKEAGLITSLITDAGLTEFNGVPTITCGAVGPAYPEEIDKITRHLKLL